MSAPGKALLCAKGHLFQWVRKTDVYNPSFKPQTECPCGSNVVVTKFHYDRLEDLQAMGDPIPFVELVLVHGELLPRFDLSEVIKSELG